MIFLTLVCQREFPLITIYHILSGYYDMAAGQKHVWSSAIVLWWQIYYRSRHFRGNRKKAWWETDSASTQLSEALKRDQMGLGWGVKKKGQTYISKGILQSTVRLTRWLPTAKTRVCHWLSASRAPRKTQFSIAPRWPLKRKCRRFLESLSPTMRRPCSLLSFSSFPPSLLSFSSNPAFSSLFGCIKVKMYSFLYRSNTRKHSVW